LAFFVAFVASGLPAPPQENFSLHGVSDIRVGWSRAAKDMTLAVVERQVV
jgi:hypothetical protein